MKAMNILASTVVAFVSMQAAAVCSNFSGAWSGTCVNGSSETSVQYTISQNACDSVSINGHVYFLTAKNTYEKSFFEAGKDSRAVSSESSAQLFSGSTKLRRWTLKTSTAAKVPANNKWSILNSIQNEEFTLVSENELAVVIVDSQYKSEDGVFSQAVVTTTCSLSK